MKKDKSFNFYDNGLDYIRLFAALQIAMGHFLTLYWWQHEDFPVAQPYFWGMRTVLIHCYGVIILFALSGYLTAHSLENNKGIRTFIEKRIKRIYPGLWCAVLFSGLILFLIQDMSGRVKAIIPWILLEGLGIAYTPQVFEGLSSQSINGALWTIMVELQFYGAALLLKKWHQRINQKQYTAVVLFCFAANIASDWISRQLGMEHIIAKLLERSIIPYLVWFMMGMFVYRFKEKIIPFLTSNFLYLFLFFVVGEFLLDKFPQFKIGYYADALTSLLLPLLALGAGYGIGKRKLSLDITYGIFLYHWPILNILIETGTMQNFNARTLIVPYLTGVLVMGIFSWQVIEKRFVTRWYMKAESKGR